MGKKILLLALASICATLLAWPGMASAQSWHFDHTPVFSVTGSGGLLTTSSFYTVVCQSTQGSGAFSSTTEGTVSLLFGGCNSPTGISCTTPGQPNGTVVFSANFDAIVVATNKPAILLTPKGAGEPTAGLKMMWEMSCLGLKANVFGKGMIGTFSAPECGKSSSTATIVFASSSTGVQQDMTYTGSTFDVSSTISTSHPTFSIDASWTLNFSTANTMTCTH